MFLPAHLYTGSGQKVLAPTGSGYATMAMSIILKKDIITGSVVVSDVVLKTEMPGGSNASLSQ